MNINDVAMVKVRGNWFIVLGFDAMKKVWLTKADISGKDNPFTYKEYAVTDKHTNGYMDRAGNIENSVTFK